MVLTGALLGAPGTDALAANANKPHPHQGVLTPYTRPAPLVLAPAERARVLANQPVMRQTQGDNGGRGLAVFRVNAPPAVVWAVINDFESYPKWISNLRRTRVYRRDGENIDVAFVIGGFGFSAEYFIHHIYHHKEYWGTWTLDYTRRSDLDDSVGFWRVTPLEGAPGASMVEYSVDVRVRGWIPGFIRSMFVDKGLQQATQWLKVQAEKRQAAQPPVISPTDAGP